MSSRPSRSSKKSPKAEKNAAPTSSWEAGQRRRKPRKPRRLLVTLFTAVLTIVVPAVGISGYYLWRSADYELKKVEEMPAATTLLDRYGRQLTSTGSVRRYQLFFDEIPAFFVDALLAREDQTFWTHPGVDVKGLVRATWRNLKDQDFTQGASTISMQLARNTFDLREKKSLNRKALEIALTYRIEQEYEKKAILTAYLNRIYFGSGAYGLEAAAQTYFNCGATSLNENQSALLAGIIRGPHAFSPFRNLSAALKQRDEVLARLVTTQKITEAEKEAITRQDLALVNPDRSSSAASHVHKAIRRPLDLALTKVPATLGGLEVTTTIEPSLQRKFAELPETLNLPEGCQIGAVGLQPATGDVLAILGSRSPAPGPYNFALDAQRDLGPDLIEPFLAAAVLERRHTPVPDNPVATGRQIGHDECLRMLRRQGFEGKAGKGDDLFRGTFTASPMEIAIALATLENDGQRPKPRFFSKVLEHGHLLFEPSPDLFPALAASSTQFERPAIITSTSLPKTDLWATKSTPDLILTIWLGHATPRKIDPKQRDELSEALTDFLASL